MTVESPGEFDQSPMSLSQMKFDESSQSQRRQRVWGGQSHEFRELEQPKMHDKSSKFKKSRNSMESGQTIDLAIDR